jgi:hypothetical protein
MNRLTSPAVDPPHLTCLRMSNQSDPVRQRAQELVNTPEFAKAQRQRKKVEALFAELKNQIGLRGQSVCVIT